MREREVSVLEIVFIREMTVLQRCLYYRDVCITEMSCLREMSVLERCLY